MSLSAHMPLFAPHVAIRPVCRDVIATKSRPVCRDSIATPKSPPSKNQPLPISIGRGRSYMQRALLAVVQ